ncbi:MULTISPECIES: hypothetical protein [Chromobacterium]|uniref:Uncharacterized protein n=3 Tax=Chromobacterium TaxID=535 RepID=A0A1W0D5K7_9NEIS|nr:MULTISPECIES: hypothetical protein [Chromobacterium]AXT46364.1 hypothetical protein D1345_09260 [Chromobacterium rhizoryzae]OQS42325.1 hypothetical protein B0T45_05925 [Chromobacterium haemolyticum]UGA37936.1 hypothetical protein JOS77_29050 [Chromobacterium haemolyticum]BBH11721.1 hypothetical protein CH06BL_09690 [Chromobacterium haemolyticum]
MKLVHAKVRFEAIPFRPYQILLMPSGKYAWFIHHNRDARTVKIRYFGDFYKTEFSVGAFQTMISQNLISTGVAA